VRYLSLAEVLALHRQVIEQSGGSLGIRDLGALKAAVGQPRVSFDGVDLYPDLAAKAAALCFSLTCDHPFIDGNKRTAHAAAETMLFLNGSELDAHVDDQELVMLSLASGGLSRDQLTEWIRLRLVRVTDGA